VFDDFFEILGANSGGWPIVGGQKQKKIAKNEQSAHENLIE